MESQKTEGRATTVAELVEAAFLAGYRHGVSSYTHWHNGEHFISGTVVRLSDALKMAPDRCREEYRSFLERQRAQKGGDPEPRGDSIGS